MDEAESTSLVKHTVATNFIGGIVYPADVDGYGDLDILGAAQIGRVDSARPFISIFEKVT